MSKIGYNEMLEDLNREFPKFKIVQKSDSVFMKALDLFFRVFTLGKQDKFMTGYLTTILYTVYVPTMWMNESDASKIRALRHERVHMRQIQRHGTLKFIFGYIFWPMPIIRAKFRRDAEMEAYEESMRALIDDGRSAYLRQSWFKKSIIEHFTSASYLWTWTVQGDIEKWYDETIERLLTEKR